jgi:hypothetical protein
MVAVGPLLARFYEQPMLASLMWVAAAQVILSAMGSVHHALLSRRLALKQLTKCGAAASFVSGALGIAAALAGWGVWALAVQMIIASLVYSIALWLALPWRPRLRVRLTAARPLWSFGLWVSMSSILDVAYSQGFALIVGKLHGVRDLGLFGRAQSIQSLPLAAFAALQRIALPLFVERLNDPEGLRIGFRKAISLTMLPTVPMMAGLALVADLLIVVLFGEQWRDAAPILVILTAAAVLAPMHTLNLNLLLARGESKHYLALEIRKKLVGVACVVVRQLLRHCWPRLEPGRVQRGRPGHQHPADSAQSRLWRDRAVARPARHRPGHGPDEHRGARSEISDRCAAASQTRRPCRAWRRDLSAGRVGASPAKPQRRVGRGDADLARQAQPPVGVRHWLSRPLRLGPNAIS